MKKSNEPVLKTLSQELGNARLDNQHLNKRLGKIIDKFMLQPNASFPKIFSTEAELEGAYRFFRNPAVTFEKILAPHVEATLKRFKSYEEVIIIHDSTYFQFSGESKREGLGVYNNRTDQGFFGHFALGVSGDGSAVPLGVIGAQILCRKARRRNQKAKKRNDPRRESLRWPNLVREVEEKLPAGKRAIHVTDREGDIYEMYAEHESNGGRFVNRLCHDRALNEEEPFGFVSKALKGLETVCEREVILSSRSDFRRSGDARRKHPARMGRRATLKITATTVSLKRPSDVLKQYPRTIPVNIVHVEEVGAPDKKTKVEWKLVTSEPISTSEEVLRVVDIYRTRWIIEEYFKAIKTGCNYESRQLESLHTLLNALALCVPVAHRLLLLRQMSRTHSSAPAESVLPKRQLKILKSIPQAKIPDSPNVRDALLAIARIGGHIKNNGDPGWLVIWRGYSELLKYEIGWKAKK